MNNHKSLAVYMDDRRVGTLAETNRRLLAFEYDPEWIRSGYSISPLSLPLQSGVYIPRDYDPFDGLHGVFADSMPDGWGRLLVDRMLRQRGITPATVTSLTRLAIVGSSGMGALRYEPEESMRIAPEWSDLDALAASCQDILAARECNDLDALFALGGSSGGARPKINMGIDGQPWIVKFASSGDDPDIGLQEYRYAQCAKSCGIEMPEVRLLTSHRCAGYFAVRRFDRASDGRRIHMTSAAALLETSHRIPNLDYHTLMQLTMTLTRNYEDLKRLYRLMCFNVFAHNRDDHSKNFSFLYDEDADRWVLSPAYDLTYSNSIGGEHATTVDGNGRDPGLKELLAVAKKAGFQSSWARQVAEAIQECVGEMLGEYLQI